MLTIGPLRRRARVHYAVGFSDGWGARMSANVPKYTVIQSVSTTMQYGGGPPYTQHFVEAFKSGRRHIVDSFLVPIWYRQDTKGSFLIEATAWMIPRHLTYKGIGLQKGRTAVGPWGAAHGSMGHLPTPPTARAIRRTVKIQWDNRGKIYMGEYDNDLKMREKKESRSSTLRKKRTPLLFFE